MIDWTDRSEDVLARFEAMPKTPPEEVLEASRFYTQRVVLMQDLATMVRLTHERLLLAAHTAHTDGRIYALQHGNEGISSHEIRAIEARASLQLDGLMKATDPETGERLFPDPKP